MKRKTEDLLMDIGMPVSINGFSYAAEATELLVKKGKSGCSVCQLYDDLAKRFGNAPGSIERSIRYAVEKMLENDCTKAVEARERIFRNTIKGRKITNREFLWALARYIWREEEQKD